MKRKLNQLVNPPCNLVELDKCIEEIRNSITVPTCERLFKGMERRVKLCYASKGYPIKK